MKKIQFPLWFSTIYLVLFICSAYFQLPEILTFTLFILSPVIMIWLVYSVLKNGEYQGPGFDEKFYEDHNYTRIPGE